MSMFCNQCEQAANGVGCNISGVCGKKPDVAALQDHLLYGLKSLALYADKLGRNAEIDRHFLEVALRHLPETVVTRPKVGFRVPLDAPCGAVREQRGAVRRQR